MFGTPNWHLGGVVQLEQIHGGHQNILELILRLGTDTRSAFPKFESYHAALSSL